MESKIAYLNVELAVVAEREKKREEKERKREEEIAAAKEVEQEEIFFLHVRPVVMRMISLIRKVRVMRMVGN
ncbi:hypothetical protein H5410_051947 [Solanum commersonii]|uniref:Uncharacterized protein n=1 Tax=Solanum commersonii TaxID=4109 RepID=A0A9J5X2K8_SOLCO|nr:hypothetical protein H5410_051947 [Solanum commersonii]